MVGISTCDAKSGLEADEGLDVRRAELAKLKTKGWICGMRYRHTCRIWGWICDVWGQRVAYRA
eukprot:3539644-Rhodomonas_salina.3